jgi:hypothetical protein
MGDIGDASIPAYSVTGPVLHFPDSPNRPGTIEEAFCLWARLVVIRIDYDIICRARRSEGDAR